MSQPDVKLSFAAFWSQCYATPGCDWLTRVVSQRIGAVVAWLAWRCGLSPNQLTVLGLLVTLCACAVYALAADGLAILLAALLFQLAFGFDCADGQLARATGRSSDFGAWLDVALDIVRDVAVALVLLMVLLPQVDNLEIVASVIFLYLGANLVSLHTATFVRRGDYRPHGLDGNRDRLRRILLLIKSTPSVFVGICVLWFWPRVLMSYLTILACACGLVAVVQAHVRLRSENV